MNNFTLVHRSFCSTMHVLPFEVVAHMCDWLDGTSMSRFRQVDSRCSTHRTSSHSLPEVSFMHMRMLQHGIWAEGRLTPHMRSFLALCETDGRVVQDRCCDLALLACVGGDIDTLNVVSILPIWSGQLDVNDLIACAVRHKKLNVIDRLMEVKFSLKTCDAKPSQRWHRINFSYCSSAHLQ